MKKIEIFKRRLIFKIEKQEAEEVEYNRNLEEILGEKIVYLIILMGIIALSSKLYLLAPHMNVGDVVKKDIIAPRTLKFNDRKAKDEVVDQIISSSPSEYIFIPEVEDKTLLELDRAYEDIKGSKEKVLIRKKEKEVEINVDELSGAEIEAIINDELGKIQTEIKIDARKILYMLGDEELHESKDRIRNKIIDIYDIGVIKGNKLRATGDTIAELGVLKEGLSEVDAKVIKALLQPNYEYDEETTKSVLEEKISQVDDVFIEKRSGEMIAKKGDILTDQHIRIMRAYGIHSFQNNIGKLISYILYLLTVSTVFYLLAKNYMSEEILNRNMFRSMMLILLVTFLAFRFIAVEYVYLIPIDAMVFLFGILMNKKFSAIMCSMSLMFLMPTIEFNLVYYLTTTVTFFLGMYLISSIKNRTSLINAGLKVGVTKMMVVVFVSTIMREDILRTVLNGGASILSGVFAGMLTIALLPYFERTFNILTVFKLVELGDLSHPLLKKLSVNTPGTFHHSMMVATLSENAAEKIEANAIFCRVASYYHDIGKIKRPNFYVENQRQMKNPHNDLSPSMSNLIITSHTKDGVEMAKEHGIPKEIRDIMIEHQGTTLLAYFYNKAKKLDPSVNESDFRYSGPKPRTKESAIIMLADSIEAAVRSLDEKTPTIIEKMIRKIISGKIEDNQLSEADLTFKEIETIIKSFVRTLMGIHHIRLKYPGQKN